MCLTPPPYQVQDRSSQLYEPDTGIFPHVFNLVIKYGFNHRILSIVRGLRDLVCLVEMDRLRMYTLAAHWRTCGVVLVMHSEWMFYV